MEKLKHIKPLNILGLMVIGYLGISLFQTIGHNHQLQQQIAQYELKINDLQYKTQDLTYKLQYYSTDSFKEKEARAKLGLMAPGESVIILPKTATAAGENTAKQAASKTQSNLQQWWDFLFGHDAT